MHPTACTDITGFGLLGHVQEMAKGCGLSFELWADAVPHRPQGSGAGERRHHPGGPTTTWAIWPTMWWWSPVWPLERSDAMYDPQTAGGLLITVPESRSGELLQRLKDLGVPGAAIRYGESARGQAGASASRLLILCFTR